jgi:hypothetical protein
LTRLEEGDWMAMGRRPLLPSKNSILEPGTKHGRPRADEPIRDQAAHDDGP